MKQQRIYLSPPYQTGNELEAFQQVLDANWLAPVGPDLQKFEKEICEATGFKFAVATSSGTAALHLGLIVLGVEKGDEVLTSSMTFIGAVNPIIYQGATPVFVDSDQASWNIDPQLVEDYLFRSAGMVKAIVPTHLYGMPADVFKLEEIGKQHDIQLLHDLAEGLAGQLAGKKIGTYVSRGILSFNGNKLITTSGGGAFVTNSEQEAERALYLAAQAKSDVIGYHHEAIGYNYRMSNVLAALGVEQIKTLDKRVEKKKKIFKTYKSALSPLGCEFQIEAERIRSDRWLTCVLFNKKLKLGVEELVHRMNKFNIETRPLWKPMHLQPIFKNERVIGGRVSENLYHRGLCLPSGCGLSEDQLAFVIDRLKSIVLNH